MKLQLLNRAQVLAVINPDQDIELISALRRFLRGWSLPKDDRRSPFSPCQLRWALN